MTSHTPQPGAAPIHRMVLAQARMEARLLARNGEQLLLAVVIPLIVLVGGIEAAKRLDLSFSHSPVDTLTPGVLALAVMSTSFTSLAIATGFERRYGVLKRLGSTPLSRGGLLAAKTATVLLFELVEALLIVITGIALGWDPPGGLVPALALLLIGTVAFAGIGLLMAGTLRAEANLAAANALFLVMLFLGGMAYPLDKLPGGLQAIAKLLPAAALSDTVRSVLSTQPFPTGQFFVLVAWAVFAPLAAARWFRWEE